MAETLSIVHARWDSPLLCTSRFLLTDEDSWCVLPSILRALLDIPDGRAAGSHSNDAHSFLNLGPVGDRKYMFETALRHPRSRSAVVPGTW